MYDKVVIANIITISFLLRAQVYNLKEEENEENMVHRFFNTYGFHHTIKWNCRKYTTQMKTTTFGSKMLLSNVEYSVMLMMPKDMILISKNKIMCHLKPKYKKYPPTRVSYSAMLEIRRNIKFTTAFSRYQRSWGFHVDVFVLFLLCYYVAHR